MKRLGRRAFVAAGVATTAPAITPEAIEADPTLTDEQKAELYDQLFEYTGDGEDDTPDWNDI
jgi:hypothetical protein